MSAVAVLCACGFTASVYRVALRQAGSHASRRDITTKPMPAPGKATTMVPMPLRPLPGITLLSHE